MSEVSIEREELVSKIRESATVIKKMIKEFKEKEEKAVDTKCYAEALTKSMYSGGMEQALYILQQTTGIDLNLLEID